MRTDVGIPARQRGHAKSMRHRPTEAEAKLWRLLRSRRLADLKWRRQVPVGPYILDFMCVEKRLAVEADGSQHAIEGHDSRRDTWLAAEGWTVLRFWNHEILNNAAGVMDTIAARAGLPW